MVERYLKELKVFVRKTSCLEGSMVLGYMIYESFLYITECCFEVEVDINMPNI
jgi:hypothetical protein